MALKSNLIPARPLHSRIRGDFEERIMSGVLKPGDRIPFEHELMAEYGCSRMTVNKAMSSLAGAGLIHRRRRAGSFVAQQHIDMAALAIPDIRSEIESRGSIYAIELVSRHVLHKDGTVAADLAVPDGTMVLGLVCRHLADTRPFAVEHRLINLDAVPDARQVDFGSIAPGSWLLANVPWTEAENRIYARLADGDATLLAIDAQAACLGLERRTWRGEQPITHVHQVFPAQGFSLVARFMAG
ncbi:histidine utilization repressor [Sphingomonas sp. PB4P5]|uniref:histidine utilization repressor n=1 Tax=Parasphingomonas puruogangriensis TaxID=3096155 RepID=UPI002FC7F9FD